MLRQRFAPAFLVCLACWGCSGQERPLEPAPEQAQTAHDIPPESVEAAQGEPSEPFMQAAAKLCAPDSDALADAQKRHKTLETAAQKLDPATPPAAFTAQLKELYEHECLAVGRGDDPGLEFEIASGLEARAYWDAGLDMWFRTYLDGSQGAGRTAWLLPTQRAVVTAQTRPEDPLAPWMCSADAEDACARRVSSWRARAQRTFELFKYGSGGPTRDCDAERNDGPDSEAYVRWRACHDEELRRHASVPIGGLGALEDGWVVVYGRRGHYQYCDEVAAFDLSSGAHYRFADCARRPEIDGLAAAAGAPPPGLEVETGTISTELLQEFAWMTLSIPYVQRSVVTEDALGRPIPEDLRMSRPPTPLTLSGLGMRGGSSSGHTTLGWVWTRARDTSPAAGELSWPDSRFDPAQDHAARLLAFAEGRATPGCAPEKLPTWVVENVSDLGPTDRESTSVDPPSEALLDAMRRQLKKGRCADKSLGAVTAPQ